MHEFLVSTAAFIVLVGIMVVVHEFGHFAVAKLCKVRVEAFSFGFGPRLFGVKYGETDYKVCLLPLGGYVKMTGETPDQISGPEAGGRAKRNPRRSGLVYFAPALAANADRRCGSGGQLHPGFCDHVLLLRMDQ